MVHGDNLIYVRIDWKNYPNDTTPLNEYNLNKMDLAIFQTDERVKWLNDNKFDKSDSFKLIKDMDVDEDTGIWTITFYDNTTKEIDTLLEKIAINFDYDKISQKLIITLDDGEVKYIDLSALITQFEFLNSDTIHWIVEKSDETAFEDEWNYGTIGFGIAQTPTSTNTFSKVFIESDLSISDISGTYKKRGNDENFDISFERNESDPDHFVIASFPDGAFSYEMSISSDDYSYLEGGTQGKVTGYYSKKGTVKAEITEGSIQEKHLRPDYLADIMLETEKSETYKNSAETSAKEAESFAHGDTGIRQGEDTDNSKYYYEQSKDIYDNFNAAGNVVSVNGQTGVVNITPENIGSPSNEYMEEHYVSDYVSSKKYSMTPNVLGWYRIAKTTAYFTECSCVVNMKRFYNNYPPEFQKIQLATTNGNHKIIPIVSLSHPNSTGHLWTKVRYIHDTADNTGCLDIYCAMAHTHPDTWRVTIEDALGVAGYWKVLSTAEAVDEIVSGETVLATSDLTANFNMDSLAKKDGSNASGTWGISVTGNAATAEKATQDGDGNVISDTYAKKIIYGDTTINLGRTSSSTPGNNSSTMGYNLWSGNFASVAIGKNNKGMTTGGASNTQVGDAFVIGNGTSPTSGMSNAIRVTYLGDILGTKAFQSSGADYAEFIKPWADGNPDAEDRVGYFVTVKDGMLQKANAGDYIAGITSGNPSVVGNGDEDYYWKYERDEFNRIMMEDVPEIVQAEDDEGNLLFDEETYEPVMIETGNIIKNARMKLAENYEQSLQASYVPRAERKEWDYVGMVGVLPVRDDGTCLPDHLCKCGQDGIATLSEQREFDTYYVIERISENIVSVELR